jgi:hypothetical protein
MANDIELPNRMGVFISWSGPRSGAAAKALRDWLPQIINALKPWLSSEDIDKGTRWSPEIAAKLEASKAGIICLTPENLDSEWILFEAGALSKTVANTFVCPLLIGLEPANVQGPLAQFQLTNTTKDDFLRLVKTLNRALGDAALPDAHIEEAFEVWWPKLELKFTNLLKERHTAQKIREDRDLLEEILEIVRTLNRSPLVVAQPSTGAEPPALNTAGLNPPLAALDPVLWKNYLLRSADIKGEHMVPVSTVIRRKRKRRLRRKLEPPAS